MPLVGTEESVMEFLFLVVIGTSIWMFVDSNRMGYDPKQVGGFAGMSPVGWLFAGIFIWIIAFPLYLVKRGDLQDSLDRPSPDQ